MGFIGVYSAVYDYQPQGAGELDIREGDLLYILEKNTDDDWWRAKKKAGREDEDEPEGLVPNNYVEEVSLRRWNSPARASLHEQLLILDGIRRNHRTELQPFLTTRDRLTRRFLSQKMPS
jgi:hypothetical protein